MRVRVIGGLGDEVMTTALVRELRRERPEELVRLWRTTHPSIWEHNPRLWRGSEDDGRLYVITGVGPGEGSFWEKNGGSMGVKVIDRRPEMWLSDVERESVARALPDGRPVVAVDTWAGWPEKRWPFERFAAVVQILRRAGWRVADIGSHGSKRLDADLDLIGKLSPRETVAFLARCSVYLGNDSAGMHLAAAADTPQVIVYGHTRDYGMWYDDTKRIVSPTPCDRDCGSLGCGREHRKTGRRCMWEITPQDVAKAVERVSSRRRSA